MPPPPYACVRALRPRAHWQVVLVGATITSGQIQLAAQAGWIHEPVHVLVGKEGSIPSGLQHR